MTTIRRRLLAGASLAALGLALAGQAGAQSFAPRSQAPAPAAPALAMPDGLRPGLLVEAGPRRAPEDAPPLVGWLLPGSEIPPWSHAHDRGIRNWTDPVTYRIAGKLAVRTAGPVRLAVRADGLEDNACTVRMTVNGAPVLDGTVKAEHRGFQRDHRPQRLVGETREMAAGLYDLTGRITCMHGNIDARAAAAEAASDDMPTLRIEAVRPGEAEASPLRADEIYVDEALAARAAPVPPAPLVRHQLAEGQTYGWSTWLRPGLYGDQLGGAEQHWAGFWTRPALAAGVVPAAGWMLGGQTNPEIVELAARLQVGLAQASGILLWEARGTLTARERGPHWIALPVEIGRQAQTACRADLLVNDQAVANLAGSDAVVIPAGRTRLLHAALVALEPGDYDLTARVVCDRWFSRGGWTGGSLGVLIRTPSDTQLRPLRGEEIVSRPRSGS